MKRIHYLRLEGMEDIWLCQGWLQCNRSKRTGIQSYRKEEKVVSDKKNEDIRYKYAESESNLKKEISKLRENISDIKKKHSKEILNLEIEHFQVVTRLLDRKLVE